MYKSFRFSKGSLSRVNEGPLRSRVKWRLNTIKLRVSLDPNLIGYPKVEVHKRKVVLCLMKVKVVEH